MVDPDCSSAGVLQLDVCGVGRGKEDGRSGLKALGYIPVNLVAVIGVGRIQNNTN